MFDTCSGLSVVCLAAKAYSLGHFGCATITMVCQTSPYHSLKMISIIVPNAEVLKASSPSGKWRFQGNVLSHSLPWSIALPQLCPTANYQICNCNYGSFRSLGNFVTDGCNTCLQGSHHLDAPVSIHQILFNKSLILLHLLAIEASWENATILPIQNLKSTKKKLCSKYSCIRESGHLSLPLE